MFKIGTATFNMVTNRLARGAHQSLTLGSSCTSRTASRTPSTASHRSALSNSIKITHPSDEGEYIDIGTISEKDETLGEEREAAKDSPQKGKQRVSSKVCLARCIIFILFFTLILLLGRH